jgi:hypothetical protein
MSAYGVGSSANTGPGTPDYLDLNSTDVLKETVNNRIISTGYGNQGALLVKDTLDVPIENWGIFDSRSESSRPSLMPLIRTRFVNREDFPDFSTSYYQELRDSLPSEFQRALSHDESLFYFEERDPQWIAFDQSLHFLANLHVLEAFMKAQTGESESVQAAANQFMQLPQEVKAQVFSYVNEINQALRTHLNGLGPNDPSYDLLSNALALVAKGLNHLSPHSQE